LEAKAQRNEENSICVYGFVPARHGGSLGAAKGEQEEQGRSDEFSIGSHQMTL
jgi:hypothetical protein